MKNENVRLTEVVWTSTFFQEITKAFPGVNGNKYKGGP